MGPQELGRQEAAVSVELAFRERMQILQSEACSPNPLLSSKNLPSTPAETAAELGLTSPNDDPPAKSGPLTGQPQKGGQRSWPPTSGEIQAESVDKSSLALMEPRRYRNKDHVRFVATQPCTVCGRQPSDPHHIRFYSEACVGPQAIG